MLCVNGGRIARKIARHVNAVISARLVVAETFVMP
jgi:hypothetical protein